MAKDDGATAVKPDAVEDAPTASADIVAKAGGDARLVAFLSVAHNAEPVDPDKAALDIVRRILAGQDAETVLQQTAAIHARDVLGQDLTITGYDVNESDLEGTGPDFYFLINVVDENGELSKITCGAINVMAQLFRLGELQAFPLKARIVETGKPTKAGFKPMWLEASPPSF